MSPHPKKERPNAMPSECSWARNPVSRAHRFGLSGLIGLCPACFINLNSEFEESSSSSRIPIVSQSD